jgi:hypothetical protein
MAFSESAATFSPDGRWIAYTSDESGRQEVMIAAFPGPGPRRPVSTGGAESAAFAADGKTLFYRSDNHVWAAALTTDPALSVGRPYPAFQLPTFPGNTGLPNWSIDSKGERVLALKYVGEVTSPGDVQVIVTGSNRCAALRPRPAADVCLYAAAGLVRAGAGTR